LRAGWKMCASRGVYLLVLLLDHVLVAAQEAQFIIKPAGGTCLLFVVFLDRGDWRRASRNERPRASRVATSHDPWLLQELLLGWET
jgi:hypothetical protein